MDTLTPSRKTSTRRGRPPVSNNLPPSAYRHDLIRNKINGDRSLNIRQLSRELGISHMTFYRIMHGRGPAATVHLDLIEKTLGLPPLKIT